MASITATLGGKPVAIEYGRPATPYLERVSGFLGLDVESTYMDDRGQFSPDFRVRTIQFAGHDRAWVLDLSDPAQLASALSILLNENITFASHTNMDVLSVFVTFGVDISGRNIDTRALAIMAAPDDQGERDLKSLATKYGMPEVETGEAELHAIFRDLWPGKKNAKAADVHAYGWDRIEPTDPTFIRYAALDALACRRLVPLLIAATQAPPELLESEQWLSVQANRIQMHGQRVDVERLKDALTEAERETTEAKKLGEELTGGVNIGGPKIIEWLGAHGADWDEWAGERTPKGAPSFAGHNVAKLNDLPLDDTAREVVRQMQRFRSHQDAYNKCRGIDARVVADDAGIPRVHPLLNPMGASTTARMSSAGPNMQNFSKTDPRMRGLFLPDPGHTLVTIDFDQIELRVVAALAREDVMIETIKAGGDLHQLTVDLLAEQGITITRDTAKMANFLIVYGGGPKALFEQSARPPYNSPIPYDVAQAVVYGIRAQYPSIDALSKYLGMETDSIRTISHRRLPVTRNRKTDELRTYASVNYAVQSGARELLVEAWRRLDSVRPGLVWWPIHDELVLMVPDDDIAEVSSLAERAMTMNFRGVPISASAVTLRDENGISRWMTGKLAEKIAKEKK